MQVATLSVINLLNNQYVLQKMQERKISKLIESENIFKISFCQLSKYFQQLLKLSQNYKELLISIVLCMVTI